MSTLIRTVAVLALCFVAHAQASHAAGDCSSLQARLDVSPEAVREGMRKARDHGFLWRVSRDGRTSYLYGTLHAGKAAWMFPGPDVMRALAASDTVAVELDLVDPDVRARMLEAMAAQRRTELPEPLVVRMREQAAAECVPYESIAAFSPEMQVMTLSVTSGRREGIDAAYAIDLVLAGIGHGANKKVVSLETPESQLQVLTMRNAAETVAFVKDSLDDLQTGRARAQIERMAGIWAAGDFAQMSRFDEWCECLATESARLAMKRMRDDRNPRLAAAIDALHTSGKRVFAAVGALHMFGDIGLPALLEKRGYQVKRVDLHAK
jgi:uncharacterized protein YbaP (TraB family)